MCPLNSERFAITLILMVFLQNAFDIMTNHIKSFKITCSIICILINIVLMCIHVYNLSRFLPLQKCPVYYMR